MIFCSYYKLAACHTCVKKEPIGEPAAKRPQSGSDDKAVDLVMKLPENCKYQVMSHLTDEELQVAADVSRSWKRYVEQTRSLLDHAMDQVVLKPRVRGISLPLLNNLFDVNREKRAYKHMQTTFTLHRRFVFSKTFFPIACYASSLETLVIKSNDDQDDSEDKIDCDLSEPDRSKIEGCEFPKLKKLTANFMREIQDSSFPVLEKLMLKAVKVGYNYEEEFVSYEDFMEILRSMPGLKYLHTNTYFIHSSPRSRPWACKYIIHDL